MMLAPPTSPLLGRPLAPVRHVATKRPSSCARAGYALVLEPHHGMTLSAISRSVLKVRAGSPFGWPLWQPAAEQMCHRGKILCPAPLQRLTAGENRALPCSGELFIRRGGSKFDQGACVFVSQWTAGFPAPTAEESVAMIRWATAVSPRPPPRYSLVISD